MSFFSFAGESLMGSGTSTAPASGNLVVMLTPLGNGKPLELKFNPKRSVLRVLQYTRRKPGFIIKGYELPKLALLGSEGKALDTDLRLKDLAKNGVVNLVFFKTIDYHSLQRHTLPEIYDLHTNPFFTSALNNTGCDGIKIDADGFVVEIELDELDLSGLSDELIKQIKLFRDLNVAFLMELIF